MANLNFSLLRMGILFQSRDMNVLKLESKDPGNEHPVSTGKNNSCGSTKMWAGGRERNESVVKQLDIFFS